MSPDSPTLHKNLVPDLVSYLKDVEAAYLSTKAANAGAGTKRAIKDWVYWLACFKLRGLIRRAERLGAKDATSGDAETLLDRVFHCYRVLRSTVPLHARHPGLAKAMDEIGQNLLGDHAHQHRQALGATLIICSADPKTIVNSQDITDLAARLPSKHQYLLGIEGLGARAFLPDHQGTAPAPLAKRAPGHLAYLVAMTLPYKASGYSSRTQGVARAFTSNGVPIDVVSRPGFPSDIKLRKLTQKVPETQVHNDVTYHRIFKPANNRRSFTTYAREAADAFEAKLRALQPDHVIAASNFRNALPALVAARRLGLPFTYEVRGMWELTRASENPGFEHTRLFAAQQALETFICVHADRVLTLTEPMLNDLVKRGVARDQIALMPNGVSPQMMETAPRDQDLAVELGIPDGRVVIGYAGAFKEYEGLPDLAQAVANLAAKGHDICLLVLGAEKSDPLAGTPITDDLHAAFDGAGVADRLIMTGRVPFKDMRRYYALMDICPITRRAYAVSQMVSPIKPVEVLAQGKAVILSDVDAMSYFAQDETTALRFAAGDVADLEAKLTLFINDPKLRQDFGARGRHFVQTSLQWPQICARAATHIGLEASRTHDH